MTIKVVLIKNPGFNAIKPLGAVRFEATTPSQTQTFKDFKLENGYGSATTVSVSPGYGATVSAKVNITVNSVTEQTFNQIINEVKNSSTYKSNNQFKQHVDNASYSTAGSNSAGIFGWLLGSNSNSYSNQTSNLTDTINQFSGGDATNDITVANTVANIMVKNTSQVSVTASIQVTGQLLTPSATIIAVETTTFTFTDSSGNTSSVSLLNQIPLVPVDVPTGTVSSNALTPGSKLIITPISG